MKDLHHYLLISSLLSVLSASPVYGQSERYSAAEDNIQIEGYSPVSYIEENMAEKGNPEHSVSHKGKTYYLASVRQVALFKSDPEKYIPIYSEVCPYSLALGRQIAIDPERFKVLGGRTVLYHNTAEINGLKLLAQHSEKVFTGRTDSRWTVLSF